MPETRSRLPSGISGAVTRISKRGKLAEAVIEYRNAVQRDPLSFEARNKLGDLFAQGGNLLDGSSEFVRAADIRPEDPDAQSKAGELLLAVGQPELARDRAERALALAPEHFRAQLLLAQSFAGLGDLDSAVSAAELATALNPTSASAYVVLGAIRVQRDEREYALEALTRAIDVDAESIVPRRVALARFHWNSGEVDAAEAAFRDAIELQPGDPLANRALAEFYAGTNRLVEAEPYLEAIVDITESLGAQLMLADFYTTTDRLEEAAALLEPLSQDPRTAAQANLRLAGLDHRAG